MAQANAVQREPSMEEILASIRRIIEDSDTQRQTANDDAPDATSNDDESAGEALFADDEEAEAFRAELRNEADQPLEAAQPPAAVAPQAAAPVSQFRPAAPAAEATRGASEPAPRQSEPRIVSAPAAPVDPAPAARRADPERVSQPGVVSFERPQPRQSIISEQASRQVAASFGELSEAFAASRRKSFDEMAEEMMRPMLQEWMDNNLPLLVERLVREEIERVARGDIR